jgi:hypothetical protein
MRCIWPACMHGEGGREREGRRGVKMEAEVGRRTDGVPAVV